MKRTEQLPTFIAGERYDAGSGVDTSEIISLDGKDTIQAAVTNASQLREALRFAEVSQQKVIRTSITERIEVVKLLFGETARYREEIVWGLAKFRGMVAKDGHWMVDMLTDWSGKVDELVDAIWGLGNKLSKPLQAKGVVEGMLSYRSRGRGALITSSTMDGPPGIAAICHAILSGTHFVVRPSWKDTATHYMFEILHENKLDHYAQLVRWPSSAPNAQDLNQQLIRNSQQTIVFCSDRTLNELTKNFPETERVALTQKIHKYGTGIPLVVVTDETDLDIAAERIFLGARRGNGKFCLSHGPVLVQENVYKALLEKLTKLSQDLKVGDLSDREVERGEWEPEDLQGLSKLATSFGGKIAQGQFHERSMDVLILEDVPPNSPCLSQEFPGTLLALIPFKTMEDAVKIAQKGLKENNREAWTALNVFSSDADYVEYTYRIDAYHCLKGGITSQPKILLPHQGKYFAYDLSRRLATHNK